MKLIDFLIGLGCMFGSGFGFFLFWSYQNTWFAATIGFFMWTIYAGMALIIMAGPPDGT